MNGIHIYVMFDHSAASQCFNQTENHQFELWSMNTENAICVVGAVVLDQLSPTPPATAV